ncbi:MAG: GNAT family N-acetyltransferase [Aeromonas sp.]|uniref:GNAT family N-acetyltransferase n=1 Tax=Aeromonas sp. TaxID=647 RepID=UPI002FCA5388
MTRYLCWPADPARLQAGLAGWLHPATRADLPVMMVVGGRDCWLRELAGSDPALLEAAYAAQSEQSLYLRFMRPKQPPSAEQLAFFIDYPRDPQIALLLTDAEGLPLAMAQSIRRRLHPDRAEFSCIVADHFQHKGAGRRILLALALLAYGEGIREWTAEVLGQNRPMLALLKGLGLPLTLVTGREMVFVRLDLSVLGTLALSHT